MYFDVDQQFEVSTEAAEAAIETIGSTILECRGRVIAKSRGILVFSAPFWRVYGLLYFFVRQLPLGISHGIIEVISLNGHCALRFRVSLLWLRLCIGAILLLFLISITTSNKGNNPIQWTVFSVVLVFSVLIYLAALIETRRYLKKLIPNSAEMDGLRTKDA